MTAARCDRAVAVCGMFQLHFKSRIVQICAHDCQPASVPTNWRRTVTSSASTCAIALGRSDGGHQDRRSRNVDGRRTGCSPPTLRSRRPLLLRRSTCPTESPDHATVGRSGPAMQAMPCAAFPQPAGQENRISFLRRRMLRPCRELSKRLSPPRPRARACSESIVKVVHGVRGAPCLRAVRARAHDSASRASGWPRQCRRQGHPWGHGFLQVRAEGVPLRRHGPVPNGSALTTTRSTSESASASPRHREPKRITCSGSAT